MADSIQASGSGAFQLQSQPLAANATPQATHSQGSSYISGNHLTRVMGYRLSLSVSPAEEPHSSKDKDGHDHETRCPSLTRMLKHNSPFSLRLILSSKRRRIQFLILQRAELISNHMSTFNDRPLPRPPGTHSSIQPLITLCSWGICCRKSMTSIWSCSSSSTIRQSVAQR